MRKSRIVSVMGALLLTAAACGDGDGGVTAERVWARSSPMMADAGAVYMEISSDRADRLIAAAVDASIAARVEIHETVIAEGGEMDGQMTMREVGEIALPAGESVSLQPGGLHIMLLGLPAPLTVGQTFDLTLSFENAADMVVTVDVREDAP